MTASLPERLRIVDLFGRRVALWGWGKESHAAYRALAGARDAASQTDASGRDVAEDAFPSTLTVLCAEAEAAEIEALGDPTLRVATDASAESLARFEVVVKSPGISPYRAEVQRAAAQGVRFIGGTALWFAEHAHDGVMARTFCVTGTKGKSTTTALLAHLLRAAGLRTALAGNIGVPLLDLPDARADAWAIELSSYQTGDVVASGAHPQVAIVTNLHPEHLDWHGSAQRYYADKLVLVVAAKPRQAVLNAADPLLATLALQDGTIRWYGDARGWHLRGDALHRGEAFVMDTRAMPLPGQHNRSNLCAVLTALEAFGLDALALAPRAMDFRPLPHRLQPLGVRDGLLYVNDSISTTPMATRAALALYAERPVAVLIGGHDRGLPWDEFAAAMRTQPPKAVITMGQNGPRIHALLAPLAQRGGFILDAAIDLADALAKARAVLPEGGVVLLSPGAPSFGPYRNYVARGRHFAQLAGFDPEVISGIEGMGVA